MPIEAITIGAMEKLEKLRQASGIDGLQERLDEKIGSPEVLEQVKQFQPEGGQGAELNQRLQGMTTPEGFERLTEKHEQIATKVDKLGQDLQKAEGPRDLQQVETEMKQYRGTVAEHMVRDSLGDKFETVVEKQREVTTTDGKVTKPDVELQNAKEPVTIGDLTVQPGENLSIEVKTGEKGYLKDEFPHILDQVEGHGDNSLVIVSQEYYEIDPLDQAQFEAKLAEKGSHIYVLDMNSSAIDDAFRAVIQQAAKGVAA